MTATSPTAELREGDEYASLFGTAFGQAWYWLKERKRASSVALNAYVTYVTLPWHWIVAGELGDVDNQMLGLCYLRHSAL